MTANDVDVLYALDDENMERVLEALQALGSVFRQRPDLRPLRSHVASTGHKLLSKRFGRGAHAEWIDTSPRSCDDSRPSPLTHEPTVRRLPPMMMLFTLAACAGTQATSDANTAEDRARQFRIEAYVASADDPHRAISQPRIVTLDGTQATITSRVSRAPGDALAAGDHETYLALTPTGGDGVVDLVGELRWTTPSETHAWSWAVRVAPGTTIELAPMSDDGIVTQLRVVEVVDGSVADDPELMEHTNNALRIELAEHP